jgi:peptide deformylase
MILPIVAYGDPVLKKVGKEIDKDYPGLDTLLDNMWETMYNSEGVGLAAPQINKSIRLFLVDASPFADEENPETKHLVDFKRVFINPIIIDESGPEWSFEEGCLSIPDIREDVSRHPDVVLEYFDENWKKHKETFTGIAARVIQHEYDHIEGVLFTDHLSGLRKRMLKGRLNNISKGNISVGYRMRFPQLK